jgi:hypothetical protein
VPARIDVRSSGLRLGIAPTVCSGSSSPMSKGASVPRAICSTPTFDGLRVQGRPVMTFLHGTLIAKYGEVVVDPGVGRFAGRSQASG